MGGNTPELGDREGWQRFTSSIVASLSGRDPLEVLAELPAFLQATVHGSDRPIAHVSERADTWSIGDVIGHLTDAEVVFGFRIRQMLTLDAPGLPSFDQDAWVRLNAMKQDEMDECIDLLTLLRRRNLRLFAQLNESQWAKTGIHADRGSESVREVVAILAAHDLSHRQQITRILEAQRD